MSSPDGGERWQHPDPALLRLRRALCCLTVGGPGVVLTVVAALAGGVAPAVAALLVTVAALAVGLVVVARRVAAWGWAEREDDLLVRRGVLLRTVTVVPYGRVQFVDVTAGPLDRRYGLARVVLHTASAAADASMPGLRAQDAVRLRDRLAALGEARAAGL